MHSSSLFSSVVICAALIMTISSCKKKDPVQTSDEQPNVASLIDIARSSLNKQSVQGVSLMKGLESIGMNPDWSQAKTTVNSKNKTVLSVPLEKTTHSYSELNVIVNDGIPHEVVKKYTTAEDNSVQLEFYALNGNILKTGKYTPVVKGFRQSKSKLEQVNLFAQPKATFKSNVSVLLLLTGRPATATSNHKLLSFAGDDDDDKDTQDPDDGGTLHEVPIVGDKPDPTQPPDPYFPPSDPWGPIDYFPTDPVSSPGGGGDSQEDQALIDAFVNKIDKTNLKPCMVDVLKSLTLGNKGNVTTIIKLFSADIPNYNWVMKDGALTDGTNGETGATFNTSLNAVVTTFDSQKFTQASDLSIARTIMHESVHAWLVNYYRQDNSLFRADYPDLIQAFDNSINPSANDLHHDEFVRDFVGDIADGLQEFGDNKGYTFPSISAKLQFYNDMAWGGLTGTQAFQNLPIASQDRINSTISSEQSQKDINGNSKPSKGAIKGC